MVRYCNECHHVRLQCLLLGLYSTSQYGFPRLSTTFCDAFSMTFHDRVRHVELLVFNTTKDTWAAHSYATLYKSLCHFASNVPVVTNAGRPLL